MTITTSIDDFCVKAGGLSEADILRERDGEAMKLSENQNERFMDEIEEKVNEIERLNKCLADLHKLFVKEERAKNELSDSYEGTDMFRDRYKDLIKSGIDKQCSEGCWRVYDDIRFVDLLPDLRTSPSTSVCAFVIGAVDYDMDEHQISEMYKLVLEITGQLSDDLYELVDGGVLGTTSFRPEVTKLAPHLYTCEDAGGEDENGVLQDRYVLILAMMDENTDEYGIRIINMGTDEDEIARFLFGDDPLDPAESIRRLRIEGLSTYESYSNTTVIDMKKLIE